MSKQLYEEALADAKKLKEIAEDNAKRALVEAVTPRIRDLIEKELLSENSQGSHFHGHPGGVEPDGDLMTDDAMLWGDELELPANMGMETCADPKDDGDMIPPGRLGNSTYSLDLNSLELLLPLLNAKSGGGSLDKNLMKLGESIKNVKRAVLSESFNDMSNISKMISRVENMYDYVQESVSDADKKSEYELTLESFYKELNKLQEQAMRRNNFRRLYEEDGSMGGGNKLMSVDFMVPDGQEVPDDLADMLSNVEIEIVPGAGGSASDEDDMDMDMGDEGDEDDMDMDMDMGDEGDEDDMGMDMGDEGDEEEDVEPKESYGESRRLRDNLVVEIDEGMLRREIGRMKVLREAREQKARRLAEARRRHARRLAEESVPSTKGYGPGDLDDWGGSDHDDEGDPLDLTVEDITVLRSLARNAHRISERNARNARARNSTATRHAVQAESKLRAKLAESNLFNAKLIYTNKLLQNESLSKRQKAEIIERLDEAESLREVKLVYESLTKTLAGTSRPLSESVDRRVIGSSSRATRPASTNLNEGFETDRWARLAGITK